MKEIGKGLDDCIAKKFLCPIWQFSLYVKHLLRETFAEYESKTRGRWGLEERLACENLFGLKERRVGLVNCCA